MITRSAELKHISGWQQELANAVTDPAELLASLQLDPGLLPAAQLASNLFRMRIPHSYIARMRVGDINDPLLRQVLPIAAETHVTTDFVTDPVGDLQAMVVPGVLHKYHGRVLVITTGACAVHCRYCFRRHFPYNDTNASSQHWQQALEYIQSDSSINEVILSGGDPLTLSDQRLASLVTRLQEIAHVKTLRIHTRLPVVLPSRIDYKLLEWLGNCTLRKVLVIHTNHASEVNTELAEALTKLKHADATLLNQSVLLHGINDSVTAQRQLCERLFSVGVLPYYLHLLDKVQGAAHFDVSADRARHLIKDLKHTLPGYLVPRLVCEEAGKPSKTPLT